MFNPHKAGLDGVDKAEVNRVIEEISKGTPFWEAKERRNVKHQEQVLQVLERLAKATDDDRAIAQVQADSFLSCLSLDLSRVFVHIDMDAFYASVEERDNPSLASKPMAVGGKSMIATSNYAARKFGVRAGLPGFIGLKLCPELVLVTPNHKKYSEASEVVMTILRQYDNDLTIYGLDEAALNVTEFCRSSGLTPEEAVNKMRSEVKEVTGLTCSAGIAPNSMLAKIFADVEKPDGQFRLSGEEEIQDFMKGLKIRKIPGIGEVQEKILSALDIQICGDFLDHRAKLFLVFSEGAAKSYLSAAKGISVSRSDKRTNPKTRSKSAEATFQDSNNIEYLLRVAKQLCDRLCEELQGLGKVGKLITLRVKTSSFDNSSRSVAIEVPTNSSDVVFNHITRLLKHAVARQPTIKYRLLGVKMSNFEELPAARQVTLSQFVSTIEDPPNQSGKLDDDEDLFSDEEMHLDLDGTSVVDGSGRSSSRSNLHPAGQSSLGFDVGPGTSGSTSIDGPGPSSVASRDPSRSLQTPVELLDRVLGDQKTKQVPAEPVLFKGVGETREKSPMIEEAYCPVCGIILHNVSSQKLNLHINKCLDREKETSKPKPGSNSKGKAPPKRKSQSRSKGQSGNISKFFQ